MVTVAVVVATLLATTSLGERTSSDVAVAGAPARNVTPIWGAAAPAVSVRLFASARLERIVAEIWPLLSVAGDAGAMVSLPLKFDEAKVADWPGTTLL